jgi:hypothetical protein
MVVVTPSGGEDVGANETLGGGGDGDAKVVNEMSRLEGATGTEQQGFEMWKHTHFGQRGGAQPEARTLETPEGARQRVGMNVQ